MIRTITEPLGFSLCLADDQITELRTKLACLMANVPYDGKGAIVDVEVRITAEIDEDEDDYENPATISWRLDLLQAERVTIITDTHRLDDYDLAQNDQLFDHITEWARDVLSGWGADELAEIASEEGWR